MQAFLKSVELLVELASLQTAFLTLDEAIKTTNRRVNALDNVVRPKLENTISYIKVHSLWQRQALAIHMVGSLHWDTKATPYEQRSTCILGVLPSSCCLLWVRGCLVRSARQHSICYAPNVLAVPAG